MVNLDDKFFITVVGLESRNQVPSADLVKRHCLKAPLRIDLAQTYGLWGQVKILHDIVV